MPVLSLENADWNDGMDMASDKGESVAFTCFYAHNFKRIAATLQMLAAKNNVKSLSLAKELLVLLDTLKKSDPTYSSTSYKKNVLDQYFKSVQPVISGKQINVPIEKVVRDLNAKADFMMKNIRQREWIKTNTGHSFFNSYYDNKSSRIEGNHRLGTRMILTGQVFAIMSGVASKQQIKDIWKSIKKYLRDPKFGGIRLNTNFNEIQPNLGRAFSFAYGEKENGSFFNHMAVMLANALYVRGFAEEGWEILDAIYHMSVDTANSKIYPGLPEYFNSEGRGMYHYLTGSASWYFLTLLTQCFGIKGLYGDLLIEPKLVSVQFKKSSKLSVQTYFAGKEFLINYSNPKKLSYGKYEIREAFLNNQEIEGHKQSGILLISKSTLSKLSNRKIHRINIILSKKAKTKVMSSFSTNPLLLSHIQKMESSNKKMKVSAREKAIQSLPDWNKWTFQNL